MYVLSKEFCYYFLKFSEIALLTYSKGHEHNRKNIIDAKNSVVAIKKNINIVSDQK